MLRFDRKQQNYVKQLSFNKIFLIKNKIVRGEYIRIFFHFLFLFFFNFYF